MTSTVTKANDLMTSMMERENAIIEALNKSIREYNILAKKAYSAYDDMNRCESNERYIGFSKVFDTKMTLAVRVRHTIKSFAQALGYELEIVDESVPFWGIQFKEVK